MNDLEPTAHAYSFLGRGWGFPPQFDKPGCTVRMVSEIEDIYESLHILLSTRLRERVMRPNFGCNLDTQQFKPINTQLLTFVKSFIEQSILLYEPRIELDRVQINTERSVDGILLIEVSFVVRATNSPENYVYPYYLDESETNAPPLK